MVKRTTALRRSRGLLLCELCNGGRYLRTFQWEISSPRTQVSFQFFAICIILNIYKTFMLKKLGNKNKNFRRSSTLICYFPFAETWLTVVTRRKQRFPQFELSFSLRVKYQFTFQSSLFILSPDNRQQHRVSLEKCSPNTQTYALMSRYLRCVIMSHRVSRGGIESNCFRVHLQCLLRSP